MMSPPQVDLPLLSKREFFAKIVVLMSLEKSICPHYHHIVPISFHEKYNDHQRFTWKFDLPLESRAEIFAKISKFWLSNMKKWTVPIISHNIGVFKDRSGSATSNIEPFVKVGEWLLAIHYFFTKSSILD